MSLLNRVTSGISANGLPSIRRRGQSFFSSLGGAVIGLALMVIGSPIAAWFAESQHREADFLSAKQISATELQDGYIAIEGALSTTEPISCYSDTNPAAETKVSCLYSAAAIEEYVRSEKKKCGSTNSNQEIIRQLPNECDSNGNNCEACNMVAEYDWDAIENGKTEDFAKFTVGAYTVQPSSSVNWYNTENKIIYAENYSGTPKVGDRRTSYTYFEPNESVLVVGVAAADQISNGGDKLFIVSNLGYAGTQTALATADSATKWILRIVALVLMVLGATMVVGPLTYFTNIFRFVPILGKHLDRGLDGVIIFFAGLFGLSLWLLLWGLVLVIKNIWIIAIILLIVAVVVIVLITRGKAKTSTQTTTPAQPPIK
ncbi:MAG: hypothetical protein ACD_43C00143G0002 [uncultured bacterium]|nr:MAG: hypothetical protein ACD_43C00143G0002 [uncultured bacterium]